MIRLAMALSLADAASPYPPRGRPPSSGSQTLPKYLATSAPPRSPHCVGRMATKKSSLPPRSSMFIANLHFVVNNAPWRRHTSQEAIFMATSEVPWKCHEHMAYKRNKHGRITRDMEILLTFCSAKSAYQFLHCKIGVSPHIKVDICHVFMRILWHFCGDVCL